MASASLSTLAISFTFVLVFSLLNFTNNVAAGIDDAEGVFTQTLDVSGTVLSARLAVIPYQNDAKTFRFYLGAGIGSASLSFNILRVFLSSTADRSQGATGSSTFQEGFVGLEFFVAQNYSFGFEVGYRRRFDVTSITQESGDDVLGNTVTNGATLSDVTGAAYSFDGSGLVISSTFNLHF